MLTITALIDQALTELQDDGTRWPRVELLGYYNAGQRQFAQMRPDQVAADMVLTLVEGARQTLPLNAIALMNISHNLGGRLAAITMTDVWALDAVMPQWRAARATGQVVHFMRTLKDPTVFQVYPPALAGTQVEALVAMPPADVAAETGAPTIPSQWLDAVRHYVLFRAWSKDAEVGQADLAAAQLQLFSAALGAQSQSAGAVEATK